MVEDAGQAGVIEITPVMIEAGAKALLDKANFDCEAPDVLHIYQAENYVTFIYRAMVHAQARE